MHAAQAPDAAPNKQLTEVVCGFIFFGQHKNNKVHKKIYQKKYI